jgi:NAD+ kinase
MKNIGVIANCRKPQAGDILKQLARKAGEHGLELFTFGPTAEILTEANVVEESELISHIDVLMALGGDGTMLNAVRSLPRLDTPVLGVNLGSLGFMTSVAEEDVEQAVEALAKGTYTTSQRTVIDAHIEFDEDRTVCHRALNDVVIGWGRSSRMVTLELEIDGEQVTSYSCDGLIISTPTGSTGHSLSASGAIIHPEAQALLVNVICPHTLSARPIVVPDWSEICVTAADMESSKQLILAVDGQTEEPFSKGNRLKIKKHEQPLRFIHLPGYSYFSLLRQKLHWRGSYV